MNKTLTLPQRVIVAADFVSHPPSGPHPLYRRRDDVRHQTLALADAISDTGVYLKSNSGLRGDGYGLMDAVHQRGLLFFADLKIGDIPNTLATDGELLWEAKPELLTAFCSVGSLALRTLAAALPNTEVLGLS